MTISAVAGTFDVLHSGHKKLIDRAFLLGDSVIVGITSDTMARGGRSVVNPLAVRIAVLEDYLSTKNGEWEIHTIDDPMGPKGLMDRVDVLVVSEETAGNGRMIAEDREKRGVKALAVDVVSMVSSSEGAHVHSRNAHSGECGCDGETECVTVSVGSLNPIKVEAVRAVMEKAFGSARILPKNVSSGVPEQPFGDETLKGAENRARAALGDSDYSVGIEAGVFEMADGLYDIQHCVIVDRNGNMTRGMGPGFRYPDDVAELVRSRKTVGKAVRELYGDDGGRGAIWILSGGLLDRYRLTQQSVIAAMVPRRSP